MAEAEEGTKHDKDRDYNNLKFSSKNHRRTLTDLATLAYDQLQSATAFSSNNVSDFIRD